MPPPLSHLLETSLRVEGPPRSAAFRDRLLGLPPIPASWLPDRYHRPRTERVAVGSRVVQSDGGTGVYFRDPDGHSTDGRSVEIATPGSWPHR